MFYWFFVFLRMDIVITVLSAIVMIVASFYLAGIAWTVFFKLVALFSKFTGTNFSIRTKYSDKEIRHIDTNEWDRTVQESKQFLNDIKSKYKNQNKYYNRITASIEEYKIISTNDLLSISELFNTHDFYFNPNIEKKYSETEIAKYKMFESIFYSMRDQILIEQNLTIHYLKDAISYIKQRINEYCHIDVEINMFNKIRTKNIRFVVRTLGLIDDEFYKKNISHDEASQLVEFMLMRFTRSVL
jgi:hypothetical protein